MFAIVDERAIRSLAELTNVAVGLGDTIVLDDTLGLSEAVSMVWDLRSVVGAGLRTFIVPTEPTNLSDGSFAVRATKSFAEVIGKWEPRRR